MTEVIGEAVIVVSTDAKSVSSGATAAGQSAGQDTGKGFKSGFMSSIKGLAAAAGLAAIGTAAVKFAGDSLAEAREAEKVGKTTEAVIKATGGAAKISAGQVSDLAESLSRKSGVDDEVIQTGENLLLTFKNVRNEASKGNDMFNQATAAAVDLSAAGFGSIEGASKMLGKALNDPIAGISALGRAGVTFSEDQKEAIKKMVETGDTLGAQKAIMKEVQSQVGGVAEANASAADKSKVAWGNLQETVGTQLLPIMDRLSNFFTNTLAPAMTSAVEGIGPLFSDIKGDVEAFFTFLEDNQTTITVVAGLITALMIPAFIVWATTAATTAATNIIAWLTVQASAIASAALQVAALTMIGLGWIKTAVLAVANAVIMAGAWLIALGPIGLVIAAIAAIIAIIVVLWMKSETFRSIVLGAWDAIKAGASALWEAIKVAFDAIVGAVQKVASWVADLPGKFVSMVSRVVSAVTGFVSSVVAKFTELVSTVVGKVAGFVVDIVQFYVSLPGKILNALGDIGASIAAKFQGMVSKVSAFVSDVLAFFTGLPGKILNGLGDIGATIAGKFSGIVGAISDIPGKIVGVFSGLAGKILNAIGSIDLGSLIKGPGKLLNAVGFAEGGGVRGPTLAVVGEGGPELMIPAGRNAKWTPGLDTALASVLEARGMLAPAQGGGPTINVTLPTGDPHAAALAVMDRLAATGSW